MSACDVERISMTPGPGYQQQRITVIIAVIQDSFRHYFVRSSWAFGQGEESRRQARCGARRRRAKPESAPSDWHPSAGAALGAPPWRGDFLPCDPRKPVYHRRISAPGPCRPHAFVVAAGAEDYELGALSRRVERRRSLRLLVRQKPSIDSDLTK